MKPHGNTFLVVFGKARMVSLHDIASSVARLGIRDARPHGIVLSNNVIGRWAFG
jgi:hypothetical protein